MSVRGLILVGSWFLLLDGKDNLEVLSAREDLIMLPSKVRGRSPALKKGSQFTTLSV